MTYQIGLEDFRDALREVFPLLAEHYGEMRARLASEGVDISEFDPRLDAYCKAAEIGQLLHFVARGDDGQPVGYANVYLTNDMHNGDLIAREDAVFVTKAHRNGVGRKLMLYIIGALRAHGVKRGHVTAVTDPRVVKLWTRMGFKPAGMSMIFNFETA